MIKKRLSYGRVMAIISLIVVGVLFGVRTEYNRKRR